MKERWTKLQVVTYVNADVASLHAILVAETVYNARRHQDLPNEPSGKSHQRGISDDME